MKSYKFGEDELFSITVWIDGRYKDRDYFFFSSMSCFGEEIGDRNIPELLSVLTSGLKERISGYNYEFAGKISNFDGHRLFDFLENEYNNATSFVESSRVESIWLTLQLGPAFDGDFLVVLSGESNDRIVWKKYDCETIREGYAPSGYVFKTINELLKFFSDNFDRLE